MAISDIENDLQEMLLRVAQLTVAAYTPGNNVLTEVSLCLTAFVARHRTAFSFENFPLPTGEDNVLASYELNDSGQHGPSLLVNAIRGGVNSVVHDHGTWAVIVGIEGTEHHRIYRHTTTLELVHEVTVFDGQSLVLEEGFFHSIHTDADRPALQLHLYGRPLDTINGRRIVDLSTGQIVYLEASKGSL